MPYFTKLSYYGPAARALLGKVDEAMGDVDEVLREVPQHPAATLHRGLLLLKKGLASEARSWIEGIQDPEMRSELDTASCGRVP